MWKKYYLANKAKVLAKQAEYRQGPQREAILARKRAWYKKNYHIRAQKNGWRPKAVYLAEIKTDPKIKAARKKIYTRVHRTIHHKHPTKIVPIIECSRIQLRQHLESKFSPQMSWDNYGTFWEVDHIIPLSAFNLLDPEQFKTCSHFSNLQPLLVSENIKKSLTKLRGQ